MALDKDMFILRSMVRELEDAGYAVEERVVDTSQYGVPQFRQRLILVALRDQKAFTWPAPLADQVTVWNAIGDLPSVEGGDRPKGGAEGSIEYEGPTNKFQRRMREGIKPEFVDRIQDQITRPVRDDDKAAFQYMDSKTRYSDLPKELRRYRDDIFDDKYKRLAEDGLSRTITAHIAKDGYWYIHPRDNRTLTIREAARLQTFPDKYRFAGPPSAAFRQIGNAVPPFLGEQLGMAIRSSLDWPRPSRIISQKTGEALAQWFRKRPESHMLVPWLKASTRWQVISADFLLERLAGSQLWFTWKAIEKWKKPAQTLAAANAVTDLLSAIGRKDRARILLNLAERLIDSPDALDSDKTIHEDLRGAYSGSDATADLAILAVPSPVDDDESEEPVLAARGTLRVAARFEDEPTLERRNRMSDGRLAIARMIGYGDAARDAQLGLIELAASVCRRESPSCSICPLAKVCASSEA